MSDLVVATELRQYGAELRTWRERRHMSQQAAAAAMNYDPSRIGHIEAGRQSPSVEFTRQAEVVLQAGGAIWARWEALSSRRGASKARTPERDLRTIEFVSWLTAHSPHTFPDVYAAVCAAVARLENEPASVRHGRAHARRHVTRAQVADVIRSSYGPAGFLRARAHGHEIRLSILADPSWLATTHLGTSAEVVRYVPSLPRALELDPVTVGAAIERLADAEVNETVMVNNPLYRLLDYAGHGRLDATVTTADFAEYALTADMLGDELVDSLAAGTDSGPLPLRSVHLPDTRTAMTFDKRVCVGGLNALVAVARNARPGGEPDYVLFVQERSSAVVNQPGALAVIPKAFHQPTGEAADEVRLSTTLRRELEEELLGRADLEGLTPGGHHHVDPMHAQHTTEPLAWLLERPDAFRTECTGFGINMVTGSYDFPCLVVIDDPTWWDRFGHTIETNWEAQHVHRYSTLDTDGLAALIQHPRWSNEGLFALLLGLRRLAEVGDSRRLALPEIELAP